MGKSKRQKTIPAKGLDGIITFSDLLSHCETLLGPEGILASVIKGFESRSQQIELTVAIAQAIQSRSNLIAEAGTGTGKTFAYLLPCLLSGKKALISTATKTLQDQLVQKDLPLLVKALKSSTKIQNLKGRANYLCRYRIELHAEEHRFLNPQAVNDLIHVREKLPRLKRGERNELPEIPEDSPAWPYVTSSSENCLGIKCEFFDSCFLVKARRRAQDADVVVINHHLYFADSHLKNEGISDLLPQVDIVVFDEAHQLSEIAQHFYGRRVGTGQYRDLLNDILREWPPLDLPNQPLQEMAVEVDELVFQLLNVLPQEEKIGFHRIVKDKTFQSAWQNWIQQVENILHCFEHIDWKEIEGLVTAHDRLMDLQQLLKLFTQVSKDHIQWIERFRHNVVFHITPLDISQLFKASILTKEASYVFTSATLTMAESFDCFKAPLGLEEAKTLLFESPFNYRKQALLYLPRSLPDPQHVHYYDALLSRVIPVIEANEGGCFFLFTSHKALKQVAQQLVNVIKFPLLVQGEEAKPILLERFRAAGNAVLLGTATFWEGVDVKGDALSCVIIDKLPFASPTDPVIAAKLDHYKKKGFSGFNELSLPKAVLALKQGVGRLIRDRDDKGVIVLADPRLTSREYARQIFASLPRMPITREEQTVLAFIRSNHEITSD